MTVHLERVYEEPHGDSVRVLVDRLWPRGMKRTDPRIGHWLKDIAPSNELRRWYGHDVSTFAAFTERYEAELKQGEQAAALDELRSLAASSPVTLVTATRDLAHSQAAVLATLLEHSA